MLHDKIVDRNRALVLLIVEDRKFETEHYRHPVRKNKPADKVQIRGAAFLCTETNRQFPGTWRRERRYRRSRATLGSVSPIAQNVNSPTTLSMSNNWVTEGGSKLVWLSLSYRPTCALWNKIIVLGHSSGRVFILRFKERSNLI